MPDARKTRLWNRQKTDTLGETDIEVLAPAPQEQSGKQEEGAWGRRQAISGVSEHQAALSTWQALDMATGLEGKFVPRRLQGTVLLQQIPPDSSYQEAAAAACLGPLCPHCHPGSAAMACYLGEAEETRESIFSTV